jgi:hypothetical protein
MKKDIAAIGISLILIGVSSSFISAPVRASSEVNFAPPEIALGYDAPALKPVKKREKRVSRSKIRLSPIESPNKKRFVKSKPKRSKKHTSRSSAREVNPTGRNQRIGKKLAAARGWDGEQWNCLRSLWIKESGWSTSSSNSSGSAWGIPQALPGSKMAQFGSDWRTNPATQIKWGLHYIDNRYGNPCSAWNHFQNHNWY